MRCVSVIVQFSVVLTPWTVPPGNVPFVVTSEPVGNEIVIFKKLTAAAALEGKVRLVSAKRVLAGVELRTVVEVPPVQAPAVQATVQFKIATCRPFAALVVRVVVPVSATLIVGVIASKVPPFVNVTNLLIESPGAIAVIAVANPPEAPVAA